MEKEGMYGLEMLDKSMDMFGASVLRASVIVASNGVESPRKQTLIGSSKVHNGTKNISSLSTDICS